LLREKEIAFFIFERTAARNRLPSFFEKRAEEMLDFLKEHRYDIFNLKMGHKMVGLV